MLVVGKAILYEWTDAQFLQAHCVAAVLESVQPHTVYI